MIATARPDPGASDRVGDHVIEATIALVAERGLNGFSMDDLARTAKVSKSSIYKRWRSRTELVRDVCRVAMEGAAVADTDTGSVASDLRGILASLSRALADERFSGVVVALADEAERDPEIAALVATLSRQGRRVVVEALRRGIDRGELSPDTDLDTTAVLLVGPVFHARYFRRRPLSPGELRGVVDLVVARDRA